jgi:hypothetical protein
MRRQVMKVMHRVTSTAAVLFLLAVATQAQTSAVSGRWQWKEAASKNKPQIQFTLTIDRAGNSVRGVYSVDEFINGEWQGEDGNQTAFRGQIKGSTMRIEFDPMATVPGYEENVVYKPPSDGRKPSVAEIKSKGATLVWRFVAGDRIERVPATMVLRREPRSK